MLKEILSISGKPGLYKLINNTANALIVESLLDGKRFPAYSNAKIIALEDISIYTEDEDMPLKTVFKRMYEKEEGKPAINHKESSAAITNYIESVIPEYDADRVYVSDMRKMIQWYNLLLDKNLYKPYKRSNFTNPSPTHGKRLLPIQAIHHSTRKMCHESRHGRCSSRSLG